MGAHAIPVRETDTNPERAIADDGDASFSIAGSIDVRDEGIGYGHLPEPLLENENPFEASASRVIGTTGAGGGEVVWTLDVTESGIYSVSIGYVAAPDRASDAHYAVRHPGGEAHFRVDQRRHGGTWVYLGHFYFEAGASIESGAIALLTDSADDGATVSADVVRIGGGMGNFDRGGGLSGRPMSSTRLATTPSGRERRRRYSTTRRRTSGAELAWALDNILVDELGAYYEGTFRARYLADDAGTYDLVEGAGPLAGLEPMRFDDRGTGSYDAEFADVLEAIDGAERVLSYAGVDPGAATVWFDGGERLLVLGFPFETIAGADARAALMERALDAFAIEPEPAFPDEAEAGCGCSARAGGTGDWAGALALFLLALARFRPPWPTSRLK